MDVDAVAGDLYLVGVGAIPTLQRYKLVTLSEAKLFFLENMEKFRIFYFKRELWW